MTVLRIFNDIILRIRKSPHRPILTCILDAICELFVIAKIGPWSDSPDIHHAMKLAIKNTKLTDWGEDTDYGFIHRYDTVRIVGLQKTKAKFSAVGHYYALRGLTRRMETRLQLIDYMKKRPEIKAIKLKSPIFIIGFTRTGTTFLHELLGLHEDTRMHYTWEQMDPVPYTYEESLDIQRKDREERYKKNLSFFSFTFNYVIGKQIQDIHRIGYDEPEECTTPCAIELPWYVTELAFNTFAFDELIKLGAGDTFKYYRNFLQLLTWQSSDKRHKSFTWMLKCPFHLPYLDAMHEEFPDATIVWTHRDPAECIASACSLYQTLLCMCMEEDSVDPILIGKSVMYYTHRCLELAEKTIKRLGSKFNIVHIRYADTIKIPEETCKIVIEKVIDSCSDIF